MEKISDLTETKKGIYFILGLSAIIKVLVLIALSEKAINNDGLLYISAAQHFASGYFKEGLVLYPMPLYPFLITIVHFIISDWVLAARLISLVSLILAIIPLYLISKELFNYRIAFWGCLAFALIPLFRLVSPKRRSQIAFQTRLPIPPPVHHQIAGVISLMKCPPPSNPLRKYPFVLGIVHSA